MQAEDMVGLSFFCALAAVACHHHLSIEKIARARSSGPMARMRPEPDRPGIYLAWFDHLRAHTQFAAACGGGKYLGYPRRIQSRFALNAVHRHRCRQPRRHDPLQTHRPLRRVASARIARRKRLLGMGSNRPGLRHSRRHSVRQGKAPATHARAITARFDLATATSPQQGL